MKVLFATGGSGGHIFPALQTALELKKRGHDISFAGVLDMAQIRIVSEGFICHNTGAKGFSGRSLLGIIRFCFFMAMALIRSMAVLRRVRPDKVVGFGGYGSFSVVLAGKILGHPVMILEQNVIPGKANRILAKLADKTAIGFKSSSKYFDPVKTVWTGCPCHDRPVKRTCEQICADLGLRPKGRIIVLLGGSQGSGFLNKIFFEAMGILAGQQDVQAVHMTGKNEYALYVEKYKKAGLPVIVSSFIAEMEELYTVADLVIARCGAATVAELGAFAVPSVLVPYPFAEGHQKYNGRILEEAGAALLIEQKDIDTHVLLKAIETLSGPEFTRERIRQKTEGLFIKNAEKHLADAVEALWV